MGHRNARKLGSLAAQLSDLMTDLRRGKHALAKFRRQFSVLRKSRQHVARHNEAHARHGNSPSPLNLVSEMPTGESYQRLRLPSVRHVTHRRENIARSEPGC